MKILVTGATGYIASHTITELLNLNHDIIGIDNLSNSSIRVLKAIEIITGKKIKFYQCDITDKTNLNTVFKENTNIDAIIHFAGVKSIAESIKKPEIYYKNNVIGSINLIELSKKYSVNKFVFSSTATLYGKTDLNTPSRECDELKPMHAYGRSKLFVENILEDITETSALSAVSLRYFNPIGAHKSGDLGEDPRGLPNNLIPYISRIAVGIYDKLYVFGSDYPTPDGTAVRDYIHIMDLVDAHIKALSYLDSHVGYHAFNIGMGHGYGVFDILKVFKTSLGIDIPYEVIDRREGDAPSSIANFDKAHEHLGFSPKYKLSDMIEDTWKWQKKHPQGYNDKYFD